MSFFAFSLFLGNVICQRTLKNSKASIQLEIYTINVSPMKEYTIAEIQTLMDQNQLTCVELVQAYMDRINHIDRAGPTLNAILETNPEAIKEAEKLDQERKEKGPRSNLHGIPIILKDNIFTGDSMHTTGGSLALKDFHAPKDAFFVSRLREAGAIILGKANLSEWANFRSTRSSSGWSSCGGQTHNPYVLDRTPCGSSAGSGVAVAANLCMVAVGTETDGSILCPAHINSVVGIKPTVGLVSQSGIIPIAHSQDTAGPMARTVSDTATLLNFMVGIEPKSDPPIDSANDSDLLSNPAEISSNHPNPQSTPLNYEKFLDSQGLHGTRIGVVRSMAGYHTDVDSLFAKALNQMEEAGAVIFDPVDLGIPPEIEELEFQLLLYEFKADLNKFFEKFGDSLPVHSLEDLIAYNSEHAQKIMPYFGQEIFKMAQEKGDLTTEEYLSTVAKCRAATRENGIDKVISEYQISALVAPTANAACPIDLINGDHFIGSSTSPAAVAGYPSITVPMGYIHGLPVGLSFFGGAYQEGPLIKLAYAYEQLSSVRVPPQYIPTLTLP
ncbi:MAG: amidase [Promethearchaeota archaeon]